MTMSAVTAVVEQVHQRARREQEVRQPAHQVRLVLRPEKEPCDGKEPEERPFPAAGTAHASVVVMHVIHGLSPVRFARVDETSLEVPIMGMSSEKRQNDELVMIQTPKAAADSPHPENTTMSKLHTLAAAALIAVASAAAAHGPSRHEDGPVRKEQTAWGIAGDTGAARRTVEITMSDDMRFTPDRIEVKQGETVRIVVRNAGAMLHEFVMGDRKTLQEHAALMRRFPGMEHDEPYMAHVNPGTRGQLVWTFNRPGDFDFACLVAGHYEAGMVGTIKVDGRPAARKRDRNHA
jgi:uncharacterized cupredoxin-like copper-binding protein